MLDLCGTVFFLVNKSRSSDRNKNNNTNNKNILSECMVYTDTAILYLHYARLYCLYGHNII